MNQRCYLRIDRDTLDEAEYYRSVSDAVWEFSRVANRLHRYDQTVEASLHFVDSLGEEPDEYPDRVLSRGPRGGVRVEKT